MPHFVIDCSENILTLQQPDKMVQEVHKSACSTYRVPTNIEAKKASHKYTNLTKIPAYRQVLQTESLICVYVEYNNPQPQEILFVHICEIRGLESVNLQCFGAIIGYTD